MQSSKKFSNGLLFLCLVLIFVITGCESESSFPTISLDTTDGQVILGDTVTITGKVIKGENELKDLIVLNDNEQKVADVEFNEDGSFSYEFTLEDDIFSTCNFRVRDVNLLSNRERITFIRGESEGNRGYPKQGDTVEEAAAILINEELVNNILDTAIDVVNNELPDLIDQIIPFSTTVPLNNILFVSSATLKANDFSLGNISIGGVEFRDNEEIVATDVSIESVYADGGIYINGILGSITVPFVVRASVNNIFLDEFKMKILFNENTNDLVLQFDADDLDEEFFNQLDIKVEIPGLPWWLNDILNWVIDLVKDLVGHLLRALFDIISIPIIDVADLSMSINLQDLGAILPDAEIYGAIWFPTNYLYETNPNCSNCGELYVQPGVTMAPVTSNSLNPDLDHFYATPDSGLPGYDALSFSYENHNMSVAVNDDTVNMALYTAIQSGMFSEYDVTPIFEAVIQTDLGIQLPQVLVSMKTPPIADWSGSPVSSVASDEGDAVSAGRYLVRNLVVEIHDQTTDTNVIRASVDVEAAMSLALSMDGTYIEAYMDRDNSDFNIGYLYLWSGDVTGLGNIVEDITLYIVDMIISSLVKIQVPSADLYGTEVTPHLYKAEVGDGNMVMWLGMERE